MKKNNIILAAMVTLFYSCGDKAPENKDNSLADNKPHYETVNATPTGIAQYVSLPAQLAAYQEVSIFPKVNGYIKAVFVDIGSHVKRGQLLMELEAPELIQSTLVAREKYERASSEYTI